MFDVLVKLFGMEVFELYCKKIEELEEDEDVDIFDNVGDDYDFLVGMDDLDNDLDDDRVV